MYYPEITMDSFGTNCPTNWEEIADYLNQIIETYITETTTMDADGIEMVDDDELRERVNALWESYCAGELEGAPVPEFD